MQSEKWVMWEREGFHAELLPVLILHSGPLHLCSERFKMSVSPNSFTLWLSNYLLQIGTVETWFASYVPLCCYTFYIIYLIVAFLSFDWGFYLCEAAIKQRFQKRRPPKLWHVGAQAVPSGFHSTFTLPLKWKNQSGFCSHTDTFHMHGPSHLIRQVLALLPSNCEGSLSSYSRVDKQQWQ